MKKLIITTATLIAAILHGPVQSQEYPQRPIRLIMPNAPGSSIDTLGRIVAARMTDVIGQTFIIENRAGAAGVLGMELGKNAAPDGYTLIVASASNMAVAPLVQKKVPYDPLQDFVFVSTFAVMPNVLVVNPELPIRTVDDLIKFARAQGDKSHMASAGPGSASHLAGVFLQVSAKFESLHVPYKGGAPSVASVVAGETHWTLTPAPAAMSLVKSGRIRAIAQSLEGRTALLPDLPAIAATVPGYAYSGWAGLIAPRGTPPAIIARLNAALARTVAMPAVKEALAAQGAEVVRHEGDAFRQFVRDDLASNARIIAAANIQPE